MLLLIVKLIDLVEALLDHFVNVTGTMFWTTNMSEGGYQWQGNIYSLVTPKGNETVGALATVIHIGSIFLAQLMLLLVAPFYDTTQYFAGVNMS